MKNDNIQGAQHGTSKTLSSFDAPLYAGVALTFNGLVVLARRIEVCPHSKSAVKFGGFWSVFCGTIEANETVEEAAVREVLEETGLNIKKEKLKHLGVIRELSLFRYELPEYESINLDYEHTEYGYFKISQIHTSPSPVDEDIARAIQYNNFINS